MLLFPFVAKLRTWVSGERQRRRPQVPFEVACSCGYLARGFRQATHQVVRCTDCGRNVFVLPASPLPPVRPPKELSSSSSASATAQAPKPRRLAYLVSILLLVTLLALFGVLLLYSGWSRPVAFSDPPELLTEFRERVRAGRKALTDGSFQSAAEELQQADLLRRTRSIPIPVSEVREFVRLHRQATLLADLLTESLEEILHRIDGLEPKEGQAVFTRRYQGKAVVFATRVRRDAAGQYQMDYRLFDGRREARLELEKLQLVGRLPLQDPHLLLFGFRLAGLRRDPLGRWILSPDPESTVLLTDEGAATACSFQPWNRGELQEILARQSGWMADMGE